jgi:phosphatidylinositol-3-phosphatase
LTPARQAESRCAECAGALAPGQRYCLGCGARAGARDPLLRDLLGRLDTSAADPPPPASAPAGSPVRSRARPALRMWVPLALAFLGFGVLIGDAASKSAQNTLASSRQPLKLVLPATAPGEAAAPANASPPPESPSGGGASEAPASESEPAPAPATAPAVAPKKKAASKTPAPSQSSSSSSQSPSPSAPASKLPAVKHVFVIMLSDQPYASVFGPASAAPYLARTLEKRGELLVRYYAVAHEQLANEIALVSGQGPTPQTAANCPAYADVEIPGAMQAGSGCVYPRTTQTLMSQLGARHLSWRAYVQGLDEAGRGACIHPALGAADPTATQLPPAGAYATFRNPFVYFRSVTDATTCQSEDVGLDKLAGDLAQPARAPSFSYIVPDRCHDGSPAPCAPAAPAGLPAADGFLRQVVPEVLASKAYEHGGLLVITVDQAPSSGEVADSSSCCGQPRFPNLSTPAGAAGGGGGQVGALLLSPFVKAGSTSQEPYNHFSLLRTIEDLFGLQHLGYAGAAHVSALEPSVFSAKGG